MLASLRRTLSRIILGVVTEVLSRGSLRGRAGAEEARVADSNRMGIIGELVQNGRLAWRLFLDRRVPGLLKLVVPGLMGAYIVFPVDLLPDIFPIVGQLDDLAVFALAVRVFIELSPKEIVRELRMGLWPPDVTPAPPSPSPDNKPEDIIDVDYRVVK